ncbi:response regulator transcription factor [Variovorax paradoxus]|nr:response regulator transcription factor [Variovorax paradoxus]
MSQPDPSLSIALLGTANERITALHDELILLGYQPSVFGNAADFLIAFCMGQRFNLLLLTLHDQSQHKGLPEVCKKFRIPTLLIVEDEQWKLLPPRTPEASWDDVMDFNVLQTRIQELEWRIQAVLKKQDTPGRMSGLDGEMTWEDHRFCPDSITVEYRGRTIHLTQLEWTFALELFRNVGRVLTRESLLARIWKSKPRLGTRTVDVCATKVRKKLDLRDENGFVLRGIYRQGYQLVYISSEARIAKMAQ